MLLKFKICYEISYNLYTISIICCCCNVNFKINSMFDCTKQKCLKCLIQGVPYCWAHFVFCHFLGFWSTYRQTSDLYSTVLEICYIIATRILKIYSETAEKVGTCNTKIILLTQCYSKMSISK